MVHALNELFVEMLRTRMVEEKIAEEYPKGEIRCPTHLSIGQELLPALFKLSSLTSDFAVSTHRGHAHYLAKGGDLKAFIAELYGKASGCSAGNGGSMHLIDLKVNFMGTTAIVGNSIPVGVGLAHASKLNNNKKVSFIFLGEGATEEGVFYEAVNYCAVQEIPAIFMCENNGYSVYADLSVRQPQRRSLTAMVKAIGVGTLKLDSSNPIKSLHDLQEGVSKVRESGLPLFVEIDTFRFLEHCGPNNDDYLNYRNIEYIQASLAKDPLKLIEESLSTIQPNFDLWKDNLVRDISEEINDAFTAAKLDKFPEYSLLQSMVYAEPQP